LFHRGRGSVIIKDYFESNKITDEEVKEFNKLIKNTQNKDFANCKLFQNDFMIFKENLKFFNEINNFSKEFPTYYFY
jgi:hypothetical protein